MSSTRSHAFSIRIERAEPSSHLVRLDLSLLLCSIIRRSSSFNSESTTFPPLPSIVSVSPARKDRERASRKGLRSDLSPSPFSFSSPFSFCSSPPAGRLHHLYSDLHNAPKMILHYGDLTDTTNLVSIIAQVLVRSTSDPSPSVHLDFRAPADSFLPPSSTSSFLPSLFSSPLRSTTWEPSLTSRFPSRWPSTLEMSTDLEPSESSTLSEPLDSRSTSDSTRLLPLSSTERSSRLLSPRLLPSTLDLPTELPSS